MPLVENQITVLLEVVLGSMIKWFKKKIESILMAKLNEVVQAELTEHITDPDIKAVANQGEAAVTSVLKTSLKSSGGNILSNLTTWLSSFIVKISSFLITLFNRT